MLVMPEYRSLWNDEEGTPSWQVEMREDESSAWEPQEIYFEDETKAQEYADAKNLIYSPPPPIPSPDEIREEFVPIPDPEPPALEGPQEPPP